MKRWRNNKPPRSSGFEERSIASPAVLEERATAAVADGLKEGTTVASMAVEDGATARPAVVAGMEEGATASPMVLEDSTTARPDVVARVEENATAGLMVVEKGATTRPTVATGMDPRQRHNLVSYYSHQ